MPSSLSALASLLLALSWAGIASAQGSCAVCEDVHFFLARGNNEPYPGRQGDLVAATCDGLSSCGYEDLIYGDLYTDLACQIAYDGAIAGITQMTAYAQKCPDSKLILAGYSTGAQVATDILAGGGGKNFNGCIQPDTPALDFTTSPANKIAAVIVFGNVRHTANQTYKFGSGSPYDGWFPRTETMKANLNRYADFTRSWCIDTDPICAAHLPNPDEESHLDYYNVDSQAAATWIKSVASLTDDSNFKIVIPTSISGTVQNYATIGTATPSGSVILDTTWTSMPSYAPCSTSSYSQHVTNQTFTDSTGSYSGDGLATKTPKTNTGSTTTKAGSTAITTKAGASPASSGKGDAKSSSSSATGGAGASYAVGGGLLAVAGFVLVTALI